MYAKEEIFANLTSMVTTADSAESARQAPLRLPFCLSGRGNATDATPLERVFNPKAVRTDQNRPPTARLLARALLAITTWPTASESTAHSSAARPGVALSRRERDVLRLVVDGRSDREIADALFIG